MTFLNDSLELRHGRTLPKPPGPLADDLSGMLVVQVDRGALQPPFQSAKASADCVKAQLAGS